MFPPTDHWDLKTPGRLQEGIPPLPADAFALLLVFKPQTRCDHYTGSFRMLKPQSPLSTAAFEPES